MTRLMLVEPEATGHRMVLYVRLMAEEALRRGWKVTLMTTASALAHSATQSVISALASDLNITKMPEIPRENRYGKLQLLFGQRAYLRTFEHAYREYRKTNAVDFVYVPYLNYIDKIVGLYGSPFGTTPFGGMILAAKFHHRACGIAGPRGKTDVVNRVLFQRLLNLRALTLATTIDEPLPKYVAQNMPALAPKIRYVPDVSFISKPAQRQTARQALGLEEGHFVIAAYGSLSPRKGLARLLSMFSAVDLPRHFRLVLAGVQDVEAAHLIQSFMSEAGARRSQVVVMNRFCSELEEGWVFAAADAMWLCYENFSGMSGVLIQSAQVGVPVITSNYGLIDHHREENLLGLRWDDFLLAASPALRFDWNRLESIVHSIKGSSQLAQFALQHSPQNFGCNVMDAISQVHRMEGRA
jgi:glycosyltransferase involved in cell wall biosynthesis